LVFIGIVTRVNANNGEIFVKIQNGFELNEIHDVDLKTTTPINGHLLGFNGTLWVNKTIAGWLGYTPQAQLNGTGFVKASGTTITYDNTSYYSASNPNGYISTYTETDTLASVTGRGSSTTSNISVGSVSTLLGGGINLRNSTNSANVGGFSRRGSWEGNSNYDPAIWAETGYGLYFYTDGSATTKMSLSTSGNLTVLGTLSASGYNKTNWDTAYGWGNHALAGYVPQARTITINGTSYDLSANRSWTVTASETDTLATVTSRGALSTGNIFTPVNGGIFFNGNGLYGSGVYGSGNDLWFNAGSTQKAALNSSGDFTANNSLRSPIFYDSNNTGYYVDPSSTSNLNLLTMANKITVGSFPNSTTNNGEAWLGRAADRPSGTMTVQLGGNLDRKFEVVDYGWTTVNFQVNGYGAAEASGSMRAPIFYDSNDTGYYWNPATDASHRFQTPSGYIDIGPKNSGTCHIYTDRPSFYFNKDILVNGSTVLNTSNAPRAANSYVMFYEGFTLNANDMSTNSTGFTYSNNAPWTGPVARFSTGGGYDLWLNASYGGNGTGLSYRTRNGDAGSYNSWHRIYSDSYRPYADDSGTTGQRSFNYLYASSYLESGGAVYGTIFYDNNNRGYYMDPDGTSQLSSIYTNNWVRVQGDSGVYSQDYGGHLRRPVNASHGTWEIFGYNKNGYAGMNVYDPQGYNNNYMHESGNGGLYQQNGNGWIYYHSRGNACLGIMTSSTSSAYKLYAGGSIYAEGDIVAYSDRRKKENIITVNNALDTVNKLRGVYYNRIDDNSKKRQIGVIAQEIQEVLPEVVTYAEDLDEYGVSYGNITGLLIEAIKEQQIQIEELKQLVNKLINK
jgi:hypothetical protein